MTEHRPIVVVSRGGEHEAVLLGTSILVGVGMLAVAPAPTSVLALMPAPVVTVWAIAWVVSGLVGAVAVFWRGDVARGLLIERAALVLNSAAVGLYATTVFIAAGWRAWVAGLFLAGWTVANLVRAWRIGREVKHLERS